MQPMPPTVRSVARTLEPPVQLARSRRGAMRTADADGADGADTGEDTGADLAAAYLEARGQHVRDLRRAGMRRHKPQRSAAATSAPPRGVACTVARGPCTQLSWA